MLWLLLAHSASCLSSLMLILRIASSTWCCKKISTAGLFGALLAILIWLAWQSVWGQGLVEVNCSNIWGVVFFLHSTMECRICSQWWSHIGKVSHGLHPLTWRAGTALSLSYSLILDSRNSLDATIIRRVGTLDLGQWVVREGLTSKSCDRGGCCLKIKGVEGSKQKKPDETSYLWVKRLRKITMQVECFWWVKLTKLTE